MTKREAPGTEAADTQIVDEIAVDEDAFSDLGESIDTDYTSISSSILDHVYENGRRYHSLSAGRYAIPNDEAEQQRLDIMHHAISLILEGELHMFSLPKKLERVLDLGTGTGIWAVDFADTHPSAHVIGVDLSPIQPTWVPPNCTFEVDDIEKPWLWKDPFDFIHSANVGQGIRDWPSYTKRIYDNLSPGGVVECMESSIKFHSDDDTVPKGGGMEQWVIAFTQSIKLSGFEDDLPPKLEGYLRDAGFVDIKVAVKKLPFGPWPKDPQKKLIGQWGLAIMEEGLKSYGIGLFTRVLGKSLEEAQALSQTSLAELRQRRVHSYGAQWFVQGRKPESDVKGE